MIRVTFDTRDAVARGDWVVAVREFPEADDWCVEYGGTMVTLLRSTPGKKAQIVSFRSSDVVRVERVEEPVGSAVFDGVPPQE